MAQVVDTADTLLGGKVRLRQPADGYRAAIDPVLLAASIRAEPGERLLELGCGVGAASLCVAWRLSGVTLVGLDRAATFVDLARFNATDNRFGGRVAFLEGDLRWPPASVAADGFDHVFANPPFLEPGRATVPAAKTARLSELEDGTSLQDWLDAMLTLVRPKGRLTLIHRADRTDEVLAGLWGQAGDVRLFPLWPKEGVSAKRVIIAARRGVRSPMQLKPGLTLHTQNGDYTAEADELLRHGRGNAAVWD